MAWKEIHVFDEKVRFMTAFLDENDHRSMTELCHAFGVSRNTGYEVLARFREGGFEALRSRSRAPLHHANITAAEIEDLLVAERVAHRAWGPKKLLEILRVRHAEVTTWPAVSTAGQILRRRGLVVPRKTRHRTPPFTQPLAHAARPNDVWSADHKGYFRTGDRAYCVLLSMAMLNYRTTNGMFKYYTNVMKSTYSHHDPLDGCAGTDPYCHAPLVPVSDYSATNYAVKWTTSECNPAGQSGGPSSFQHYGAEWDWMNFFWGLWVHSTNQYTIAEIMNLWNNTNGVHDADAARLCCVFLPLPNPNPPLGCLKRNMVSGSCATYTNYFVVGKLWTVDTAFDSDGQISDEAYAQYGTTKGNRFRDLGNWTGVDR
jgi:hypothetical protein